MILSRLIFCQNIIYCFTAIIVAFYLLPFQHMCVLFLVCLWICYKFAHLWSFPCKWSANTCCDSHLLCVMPFMICVCYAWVSVHGLCISYSIHSEWPCVVDGTLKSKNYLFPGTCHLVMWVNDTWKKGQSDILTTKSVCTDSVYSEQTHCSSVLLNVYRY